MDTSADAHHPHMSDRPIFRNRMGNPNKHGLFSVVKIIPMPVLRVFKRLDLGKDRQEPAQPREAAGPGEGQLRRG